MSQPPKIVIVLTLALVPLLLAQFTAPGQQAAGPDERRPEVSASKFEFEIIESFDAKYDGDTPGHVGKNGGLDRTRPNVALGDPVYLGDHKIGTITGVLWDRSRGSLEIEFDPEPNERIAVGEIVWIPLNGLLP